MKGIVVKIDFSPVTPPVIADDEFGMCKCGRPGTSSHSCPYSGDINGDYETECNCCDVCETACGDDI